MFTVLLAYVFFSFFFSLVLWLRICVEVDVDSSPIAHEAEGLMGYGLRGHEGERNNCFTKIQLVGQKYRE